MYQMKEQDKTPEKHPGEMEISNSLDKNFKVMVIEMLTKLRRGVERPSEDFNEQLENT